MLGPASGADAGGISALKAQYPDLSDDELMRLWVGETPTGMRLDPEGYLDVCRLGPGASGSLLSSLQEHQPLLELFEDAGEGPAPQLVPPPQGAADGDDAEEAGEGGSGGELPDDVAAEMDAVGLPPVVADVGELARPQKVWVLMGGNVDEADASMASGLEVVRKLSQFADLQVWKCV